MSDRVGAVILAAGSSSRLGRPKQTLQFENSSLLRRAAQAALDAGCTPVIAVTGAHAEMSRRELDGLDVREVWNPNWEMGMGSSIGAGIKALIDSDPQAAATVVMLCDQPYVTADVISRILSAYYENRTQVIASRYGEGFGVPALFQRSLFDELAHLEGPAGAKVVITQHTSQAHFIDFPKGEIDIDTPADYLRLSGVD